MIKCAVHFGELILDGVTTNVDFQYEILNNEDFQKGNFTTVFYRRTFLARRVEDAETKGYV